MGDAGGATAPSASGATGSVSDGPPPVHVECYSTSPERSTVSPLGSPVSANSSLLEPEAVLHIAGPTSSKICAMRTSAFHALRAAIARAPDTAVLIQILATDMMGF